MAQTLNLLKLYLYLYYYSVFLYCKFTAEDFCLIIICMTSFPCLSSVALSICFQGFFVVFFFDILCLIVNVVWCVDHKAKLVILHYMNRICLTLLYSWYQVCVDMCFFIHSPVILIMAFQILQKNSLPSSGFEMTCVSGTYFKYL